ncbi:MAG: hypothetical protein K0Q46_974 [Rhodococcus erythropolis]|jgi:hypothetical protein|nr:hypothetical protein [Rhodococcus erythropolis]
MQFIRRWKSLFHSADAYIRVDICGRQVNSRLPNPDARRPNNFVHGVKCEWKDVSVRVFLGETVHVLLMIGRCVQDADRRGSAIQGGRTKSSR